MHKYHKWTIKDGDYIRDEENIHIARPESVANRLKRLTFSIIWKVTLVTLIVFLFIKFI